MRDWGFWREAIFWSNEADELLQQVQVQQLKVYSYIAVPRLSVDLSYRRLR